MSLLWDASVLTGASVVLALAVVFVRHRWYVRWVYPKRAARWPASYRPSVALSCPCKGSDARMESNARRLLTQDYPDYRVIFATESADDPAVAVIRRLMVEFPHARHAVAGRATHHTQKIHNILAAFESAPEVEVLASVDIDMEVPGPHWLAALVRPLSDEQVTIATSFFRIVPCRRSVIAHLCVQLVTLFRTGMTALGTTIFGGTFALRRATFERIDVPSVWRHALAEDISLVLEGQRRGFRFAYVCDAESTNEPVNSLRGLWIWLQRQTQANKSWRLFFFSTLAATLAWSALLVPLPVLLVASMVSPAVRPWAAVSAATWLAMVLAFGLQSLDSHVRDRTALDWLATLLFPLLAPLVAAAYTVTLFRRHLVWAGIRYDLDERNNVSTVTFPA